MQDCHTTTTLLLLHVIFSKIQARQPSLKTAVLLGVVVVWHSCMHKIYGGIPEYQKELKLWCKHKEKGSITQNNLFVKTNNCHE